MFSFKLWCERERKRYFLVHVFVTEQQMKTWQFEWCDKNHVERRPKEFDALSFLHERKRKGKLGHILLNLQLLNVEIVSHEITHCCIFWFERASPASLSRIFESNRVMERIATMNGAMVAQFWNYYVKNIQNKVPLSKPIWPGF